MKNFSLFIVFQLFLTTLFSASVYAVDIPSIFFGQNHRFDTLGQLVSSLLPNVIILAGIIFFFLIVYYGFRLILGADSQSPQNVARGQAAVTWSIIGFIIVVTAYFIVQMVSTIIFGDTVLLNPPTI